uniref:Uncharacterized protein n=1 Tax=Haptolina ericina TaxID=156174 RepID=A0A7S3AHE8_9EUKA
MQRLRRQSALPGGDVESAQAWGRFQEPADQRIISTGCVCERKLFQRTAPGDDGANDRAREGDHLAVGLRERRYESQADSLARRNQAELLAELPAHERSACGPHYLAQELGRQFQR